MHRLGADFFAATLLLLPGVMLPGVAVAQADEGLVGTWKLVAFKVWPIDTKEEARDALGPSPQGRLILTATGYITSLRVAEGRKPAQTDAERAQLLRTMAAWTGREDRCVVERERYR
jgi:Lipocalin-like domain